MKSDPRNANRAVRDSIVSCFLSVMMVLLPVFARASQIPADQDADVLIVGAGIAGLSAALEAARDGARVNVVDVSSVFGGHAVMSEGDVTIIDTPVQREKGIHDTPALAYKDFIEWGKDANSDWVTYYVRHSRSEIYDWLTSMGVIFEDVHGYPGNSVPRAHITRGRGLGLVSPLYRECLKNPNITFIWNTEVVDLMLEQRGITGLRGKNLRTGQMRDFHARAVILATGGFQSNLALVRKHWPQDLPVPERLLAGSGENSVGSGLELAANAGAAMFNLDHQWNYQRGLPDPRFPGETRGLNASITDGVLVNARGEAFMPTQASSDVALRAVLGQPGATYWSIFDENGKRSFWIAGSDWGSFDTIQRVILDNREVVKEAATIEELAAQTGLPAEALKEAIARANGGSFKIDTPPFYAAQFFPLTRKSMGGIAIDLKAHVVDKRRHPIRGLYAAGEVTGEAGINGKAALEGTFLGPSVVIGRVAARSVVADLHIPAPGVAFSKVAQPPIAASSPAANKRVCMDCHNLSAPAGASRLGYWHFERVHRLVLERNYQCGQCHANISMPFQPEHHRVDRLAQIDNCIYCHVSN